MFEATEHFSSDFMSNRDPGVESARESFETGPLHVKNWAH
jgi:hypothetical protein